MMVGNNLKDQQLQQIVDKSKRYSLLTIVTQRFPSLSHLREMNTDISLFTFFFTILLLFLSNDGS